MPLYKVKYTKESLEELQNIITYYESASPGLGKRFKKNFLSSIKKVKANPFYASIRYDNVRFAGVNRFPYASHYVVDEAKRCIVIYAVLGYKQEPDKNWRLRL